MKSALADYPHVMALKNRIVRSPRIEFDWETVEPITRAFRRMVRTGDFDLCEIALTTLAQAEAYGKNLVALPVVVMRGFHHGSLLCRKDSPLRGPEDLTGKKVAVRAFSQTTGIWVRGILLDEYGVDHRTITWVTEEDAHVQEYSDPPNVVRSGKDLKTLLLSGEVDAVIALGGFEPSEIRTVIPDTDQAAAAWYRKTGVYPVNHVVCVKREFSHFGPELTQMFRDAKDAARKPSAEARYIPLVGEDPLPYGLEANRAGIDCCLRYAAEQGLVPRVYAADEIFLTGD